MTEISIGRRVSSGAPTVLLALLLVVSSGCHTQSVEDESRAAGGAHAYSGPPAPVRETSRCVVERIADGDSLVCRGAGRVRLVGIDTPELSQAPYGRLAAQRLTELAPVGSSVSLELDVEPRDRNGRLLAYVWADDRLVNWLLVRQGWAVVLTYPPNVQYADWLTAAQDSARQDRAGLWALDGFDCLPVEHRRGRCG